MNQTVKKIFLAGVALVISIVLIVTVTYAWMTLSAAPTAEGIEISIGGGNTILLAPDIVQTVDGEVCHYPGNFNDTLIFSRFESYDYLKQVDSLSPVSTSDGLNWFIPSFYSINDEEVKLGTASVGEVKSIETFQKDDRLLNANIQNESVNKGHYIYLDFWVVSPGADYTLRVSRGDKDNGSYLVELPKVNEDDKGFYLEKTNNSLAASTRVGFLVNTNVAPDANFALYQGSRDYNSDYKTLLGAYQEKGQQIYPGQYKFTIYEPNGNLHINSQDKTYFVTRPVGLVGDNVSLVDISDRLTVQLENSWKQKKDSNVTLDELLNVATVGKNIKDAKAAETALYDNYLQGQFSPYVSRGEFISKTGSLYAKCLNDGQAKTSELASLETAGATEDRFIVKLTKNVPQRIRMYVWVEGQDIDSAEISKSGRFALSLELAGSH